MIFDDPATAYYIVYPSATGSILDLSPASEIGYVFIAILIIVMRIYFSKRGSKRHPRLDFLLILGLCISKSTAK